MASEKELKRYLAYWFQLGKAVAIRDGQTMLRPNPVLRGSDYSREFEECWNHLKKVGLNNCVLDGADQISSTAWDILPCARCEMPVPIRTYGLPCPVCPCADLPLWPNTEIPRPRDPVDSQTWLQGIQSRLSQPRH